VAVAQRAVPGRPGAVCGNDVMAKTGKGTQVTIVPGPGLVDASIITVTTNRLLLLGTSTDSCSSSGALLPELLDWFNPVTGSATAAVPGAAVGDTENWIWPRTVTRQDWIRIAGYM
jgi:hypothetical protein